jgi:hypothetical protein
MNAYIMNTCIRETCISAHHGDHTIDGDQLALGFDGWSWLGILVLIAAWVEIPLHLTVGALTAIPLFGLRVPCPLLRQTILPHQFLKDQVVVRGRGALLLRDRDRCGGQTQHRE